MRENSALRVFVGQGYYDFATPFFAAEYALTRTGIPQGPGRICILRLRPHDVRARRGPGEAEPRRARIHPQALSPLETLPMRASLAAVFSS
jgi:hypothetical protein